MQGDRGFTLLEILLVMIIIGISMGMILISFKPKQYVQQHQLEKLVARLTYIRDQAVLNGHSIGIWMSHSGYQIGVYEKGKWRKLKHAWGENHLVISHLMVNFLAVPLTSPSEQAHRPPPQLVFDASGIVNPAYFRLYEKTSYWVVSIDISGQISCRRGGL